MRISRAILNLLLLTLFTAALAQTSVQGALNIRSEPIGAAVYVNDNFIGNAPVLYEVPSGTYEVRLEQDGFLPFRSSVSVLGDEIIVVAGQLVAQNNAGSMAPAMASETTSDEMASDESMSASDMSSDTMSAATNNRQNVAVERVQTVAAYGTLRVASPFTGALVVINGNAVGVIPSSGVLSVRRIPVGQHTLRLEPSSQQFLEQAFTIATDQTTNLVADSAAGAAVSAPMANTMMQGNVMRQNMATQSVAGVGMSGGAAGGVIMTERGPMQQNMVQQNMMMRQGMVSPMMTQPMMTQPMMQQGMINPAMINPNMVPPGTMQPGAMGTTGNAMAGSPVTGNNVMRGTMANIAQSVTTPTTGMMPATANTAMSNNMTPSNAVPHNATVTSHSMGNATGIVGPARMTSAAGPFGGLGDVLIDSNPRAVQVFIDGRYLGITPMNPIPLDPGTYQLRFVAPGAGETVVQVNVVPGETQNLFVNMFQ
ncbi:MAG: PEGA domain-containing protein [Deinococcota bacterium]